MTLDDVVRYVESLGGVLVSRPQPGDGSPEISWGDVFFYYSTDGSTPTEAQPFATIVTKDYPDEAPWHDGDSATFRVNLAPGKEAHAQWAANHPAVDVIGSHPVYGDYGWLAVVNPGPDTEACTRELLAEAHRRAMARADRRASVRGGHSD